MSVGLEENIEKKKKKIPAHVHTVALRATDEKQGKMQQKKSKYKDG